MAPRRFQAPIEAVDGSDGSTHWELNLPPDQRDAVVHLLGELRELLTHGDHDREPLVRLFPPSYVDDEEKQAEYRRLMRDDLVASRLRQIDLAEELLAVDGPDELAEHQVVALLQSINAVRVVLGTILDVGEDDDDDDLEDASAEHQLYAFLSWMLEWTVRSLSG